MVEKYNKEKSLKLLNTAMVEMKKKNKNKTSWNYKMPESYHHGNTCVYMVLFLFLGIPSTRGRFLNRPALKFGRKIMKRTLVIMMNRLWEIAEEMHLIEHYIVGNWKDDKMSRGGKTVGDRKYFLYAHTDYSFKIFITIKWGQGQTLWMCKNPFIYIFMVQIKGWKTIQNQFVPIIISIHT